MTDKHLFPPKEKTSADPIKFTNQELIFVAHLARENYKSYSAGSKLVGEIYALSDSDLVSVAWVDAVMSLLYSRKMCDMTRVALDSGSSESETEY